VSCTVSAKYWADFQIATKNPNISEEVYSFPAALQIWFGCFSLGLLFLINIHILNK